jgi:hypothetical protein
MADIDPSQSTLSPNFAPYVYDMLSRGQGLANLPYQEYTGQRFAGPSGLQSQAFQGLGSLGTPSQFGQASSLMSQAGGSSFTQPGTASTLVSPYMQNVVDIQKREAERDAAKASTYRGAAFAQKGAFGGARQAIENAEADRNLQQKMGDIQATGMQSAFDRAQQQFNAERGAQMQAAQGLGSLGTQQFGTQLQGLQALLGAGQTQQQFAQQPLDFGYQQFQESMKYPYQQATYMQSLLQGLPPAAIAARPYEDGQSALGTMLSGGLSGLALYQLLNKPPKKE